MSPLARENSSVKRLARSGSSLNLVRGLSAENLTSGDDHFGVQKGGAGATPEMSTLKAELEQARANAEKEAAHAKDIQEQMLALQEQLAQQQQPREGGDGGDGGRGRARDAPSREEWLQILEASPLASMQSKLSEVENLLRALLDQKAAQS